MGNAVGDRLLARSMLEALLVAAVTAAVPVVLERGFSKKWCTKSARVDRTTQDVAQLVSLCSTGTSMEKDAAAKRLAELAEEDDKRVEIARAGGIPPLVSLA